MIEDLKAAPGRTSDARSRNGTLASPSITGPVVDGPDDRAGEPYDIVCLSHLRWEWVTWQRPQHLMSRLARDRRVLYVEEPVVEAGPARLAVRESTDNVWVATPVVPPDLDAAGIVAARRELLDGLLVEQTLGGLRLARPIGRYVLWYYDAMALEFSRHLRPLAAVYDCMDAWDAFDRPPPLFGEREAELFDRVDLVFTGGASLHAAKVDRHPHVHLFPSSVDVAHFAQARQPQAEPPDQAEIPRPRLGFVGTLDERLDRDLLDRVATARPGWHLVMLGPVVKIPQSSLPRRPNIWYLGGKPYKSLPSYLAGWDVALMPFALNRATRYISPTKTPEYLAAGRPVVSTPVHDVVHPYGERGLVRIAGTVSEFIAACSAALEEGPARPSEIDAFLAETSWQQTVTAMAHLVDGAIEGRTGVA